RTKKPLIVRLQAPRFFVVGDVVTLSAVMNNNTAEDLSVFPNLVPEGLVFRGVQRGWKVGDTGSRIVIPAGTERRVDWIVEAREPGTARLRVSATADAYSDAMERTFTVYEHGIEKFLSRAGKVRGDDVTVKIDLPSARRAGSTSLTVQVTPSMAVTMLDALPYLIDYPYGCTEQTMSRFLPAVITARTLERLGLSAGDIAGHVFGGIETEHAAQTHPEGPRDLEKLDAMTREGLQRLYDFQHADGGWGWWKDGDSDPFMTAYVLWGLGLAEEAGIGIRSNVRSRAASYLDTALVEQENRPDLQAWMLHALSSVSPGAPSRFQAVAFDNLWMQRDRLNAYTRALLALSAHHFGDDERAEVLVRNLENGVQRDDAPDRSVIVRGTGSGSPAVMGTAHWGSDGIWWRWSDGPVEATAFALRALLAIDPDNDLIEPVTNWLVKNRRGSQWSNTRDTAITVLTLTEYLETSGELGSSLE
ncbi:MAG: alpha-2-macroglobulin, partial [Acidobacteriota bacterium]|nr:alpha-2-macroglobulin [Acidobacteriota bacterium]